MHVNVGILYKLHYPSAYEWLPAIHYSLTTILQSSLDQLRNFFLVDYSSNAL
jgi:hypothetical protein